MTTLGRLMRIGHLNESTQRESGGSSLEAPTCGGKSPHWGVLVMKWVKAIRAKGEERAERIWFASVAGLALGLMVYVRTQPFAHMRTTDKLGMATFPTIVLAVLLLASVLGLFQKTTEERTKQSKEALPTEEAEIRLLPVVSLIGASLLATFGLWRFDPIISCSGLVLLLLLIERVRDWRLLVCLSIGTGGVIYVLFVWLLNVYFPRGVIG